MSSLDREILNCLRRIKRRIHRNTIINYMIWGAILALGCGSLISIAGLLLPLYKVHVIVLKVLGTGILVSILVGLTRAPSNNKAARLADSLGLRERLATSMEFIGVEEGFAVIQKKDTLNKLKVLNYKEGLCFRVEKRQLVLGIIFCAIIFGSMAIPAPAKSKAEEKYKFEIIQEKKVESIDKVEKEIKKDTILSEEDKKELLDNLNALRQEIKEAKSISEIDNSLTKFQIKMDIMQSKYDNKDLNNLASGLSRNEATAGLANAIERSDKAAIDNEIKQLPEALKNASEQEQKKIAENFADMAKNTGDEGLKKSLNEIAQKLVENNPDKMKELADSLGNFNNSVQENVDKKLAKNELKGIKEDFMPETSTGNKDPQDDSQKGEAGGGQGTGTDNQVKPEQGKSPEGGSTSNEGQPGSGNGSSSEGSPSQGEKPNAGEGLNKPKDDNSNKGESVYVPSTGEEGGSGEIIKEGSLPPPTEPAKPQSLDKVIGKYKEKAYENMNSYVIPEAMKDIIKSYFSALEQ
ncbi:hypothetical protein NBE98_18160 [Clostridium swellfunianum]|uniref:hypothetical protein n=1 Tax=Clostridium swellfunianum TaxID=1367462 RepID=UPI002030F002|nr:hypothetical protein [Clostridium swellfunianum]MCM0650291.1 hypothetical protein [Clostridium swellfunianum]